LNAARKIRESLGLTREAAASKAGIAVKTLANIEYGEAAVSSTLEKLADLYNVRVDELLGREVKS